MSTLSWIADDSFATRLAAALLHFLWQGCAGGLLVIAGGWILHSASARSRYALNVAVLFLMAACLPVTFVLLDGPDAIADRPASIRNALGSPALSASRGELSDSAQDQVFPAAAERVRSDELVASPNSATAGAAANGAETGDRSMKPGASARFSAAWLASSISATRMAKAFPTLSRWIAVLYLTGVALIFGRLLRGVWGGHRLRELAHAVNDPALLELVRRQARRLGLRVLPTVAWCEQISIPVVVGIVRPMILLPLAVVSGLTPQQLQALLLHELSHIRRFDPIVNLLQRIVEAGLFFHPVVWYVSRRISIERELAADDMVLAAGWDRPLYADALVRVAELAALISRGNAASREIGNREAGSRGIVLGASGSNSSEFKLRVLRLLGDSGPPKLDLSRAGLLLAVFLVVTGGVFAWSQAGQHEPAQNSNPGTVSNPAPAAPIQGAIMPHDRLEFLAPYPKLHGLSLDMTEPQFLKIARQQKLRTTQTSDGDQTQHHVALGDGHTLIVMFDKGGRKCRGIQRIRGEDAAPVLRTLRRPSLLLPDHWIVSSVGFDNEGQELVTVSTQSFVTVRHWDLAGKKLIREIKLQGDKHGREFREGTLTLSGDRQRVIAATDAYVGIWETATGKLLTKLPIPKVGDNDTVRLLGCTPDLAVIVGSLETNYERTTLIYDAHTVVWDGATGKMLRTNTHADQTRLIALSLSSDGQRLATTNGGGASIWDTNTGELLLAVPNDNKGREHSDPETSSLYTNYVWSVRFSPDGKQLAMGDILGVNLLDAASGKLLRQLEGPYSYSSGLGHPNLVFSSDGQWLARLGTGDKVAGERTGYIVPIWSTQTGQKLFELHTDANAGDFSPNGQQLAVAFSDLQQALAVWELSGDAAEAEQAEGPGPQSRQDKVEENGHYHGKTAAEFIDKFQPAWGDARLGIQYGIALTRPQRQYGSGERVPLVVFFRNADDKPLKIDMRPDFFGNTPRVVDAQGAAVEFENVPLLGSIPHYVEDLEPGEAVGPFYLNFGLGDNPRPGQQHWHPYYKAAIAGKYQLMHAVALEVTALKEGGQAKPVEVSCGTIAFEIVEGSQPAAPAPTEKSGAVPPRERPNYVKVIGQLLDADTGKPIEQASWEYGMASLERPAEVAWGHRKTLGGSYPDGHFEHLVHFTRDGQFDRLRVYAAGYETAVVVDDLPSPRPLQVERIVRLKRGPTITGTLRDHTGQPVANGRVFFIPAGHRSNIVEGVSGTDANSLPDPPGDDPRDGPRGDQRDGAVAEARTNAQGQFSLSAGSAGTLAASTSAVDLWPFPLPGRGPAELKMPQPGHLLIDLSYWYLDDPAVDGKEDLSAQSESPRQCFIQVNRVGTELALAYNTVMAEVFVKAQEQWRGCQYDRQMFVFSTNPRHPLSKGVRVGDWKESRKPQPAAGAFRNRSVTAQVDISLPPGRYQVIHYRAGQLIREQSNVVLTAGGAQRLDWTRTEGAAVQGTVALPANAAFVRQEGEAPRRLDWTVPHSASVKLTSSDGQFSEAAHIHADGTFFVSAHLPPGRYSISALAWLPESDQSRQFVPIRLNPELAATEEFVVPPPPNDDSGSKPVRVNLTLESRTKQIVPDDQAAQNPMPAPPIAAAQDTKSLLEGSKAGDRKELAPGITFRWCPAGQFKMGEGDDTSDVELSKGFWIGETEVTQGQWRKLMGTSPWSGRTGVGARASTDVTPPQEGSDYTASYISHDDALSFCKKLTTQEQGAGRLPKSWEYSLPTEAQWEYACRAGTKTKFSFGDDEARLNQYAWFRGNVDKVKEPFAHQVGLKQPNAWGLHDMHGNVWEWCKDWYGSNRSGGTDPVGPATPPPGGSAGKNRVIRGGSWIDVPLGCSSANRFYYNPSLGNSVQGFRLAAVPASE